MPVIKKQFSEPILAKPKVTAKKEVAQTPISKARRRSSDLNSLKRPSDYRRVAMKIQKEKQKAAQRFLLSDGEEASIISEVVSEDEIVGSSPIKHELMQDVEGVIETVMWYITQCKKGVKMCKLRVLRAIGHIEDDIETPTMQIPDLTDISEETLKDAALIKNLEDILMTWEVHITKIIEDCLKKVRYNTRLIRKIRIKNSGQQCKW